MAYECQNFKPGQILTAGRMNKIDEWLEYICGRELTAVGTNANGELEFTFCNGTKLNCGVVGVTVASIEQSPEDDRYNVITFSDGSQLKVKNGSSGVYVGSGTPPANATVWINPEGEPTSTEDWEFDLDDGSTEEKTVVVVGSDDATANGKLAILRMKDVNGNWVEIPAIVGTPGKDGEDGYTPQKGVDYFDGTNGKDGSDGKDGVDGKNGSDGKSAYQYAQDGGFTGTEAEFMALLNSIDDKANKADIATTVSKAMSNSALAYTKISGFGAWGNGAWYEKGFSMLITSRAGELVWVAVSSDDSNTNAKAIRLLNTYSKINAIYYSASESAIYVATNAWCNNVNAHILSNINGDYVPTVETASALASDAVKITITEFGASSSATNIGDSTRTVAITGSGDRPTYNGANMALMSDLNRSTAVNVADTNYATLMARGSSLNSAETTPAVNGAIAWTYE